MNLNKINKTTKKTNCQVSQGVKLHFRKTNFTMVPNAILRDTNISFKAKCLWSIIASLHDGYQISLDRLADEFCLESYNTLKRTAIELENNFLLFRQKNKNGRVDFILFDSKKHYEEYAKSQGLILGPRVDPTADLGSHKEYCNTLNNNYNTNILNVETSSQRSQIDDLKEMFDEDLWFNENTPDAGRAGSKKNAFKKWRKITNDGENREDVIEGWENYLNHNKAYGYSIKRLEFFLTIEKELWLSEWKIDNSDVKRVNNNQIQTTEEPESWRYKRSIAINRGTCSKDELQTSEWKYLRKESKEAIAAIQETPQSSETEITFDWYSWLKESYPDAEIEKDIERLRNLQSFAYDEVVAEQKKRSGIKDKPQKQHSDVEIKNNNASNYASILKTI